MQEQTRTKEAIVSAGILSLLLPLLLRVRVCVVKKETEGESPSMIISFDLLLILPAFDFFFFAASTCLPTTLSWLVYCFSSACCLSHRVSMWGVLSSLRSLLLFSRSAHSVI